MSMHSAANGDSVLEVKPTSRKPDLRFRASVANLGHSLFGILGGVLVLYFAFLEREALLLLPGVLLVFYGLYSVGGVSVRDGVLRKQTLFRTVEVSVEDIREIGLGQLRLPPTRYWIPVVDTFDGDSIVLTSSMSTSKNRSSERVRALRKALGSEQSLVAERLAGTGFRPKKAAGPKAPKLSDYEQYLLEKEAAAEAVEPEVAPPTVTVQTPITGPTISLEPSFTTAWSDEDVVVPDEAPEVFTPRPLNPRSTPARRATPRTRPAATPQPKPSAQPAPQTGGLRSLFSTPPPTEASAEPKPKGLTSLFGSSPQAEPEPERLITLFGTIRQERAPLQSLFGSAVQSRSEVHEAA